MKRQVMIGISERITRDRVRVERLTVALLKAARKRYRCTKCKVRKVRKSFGDNASRPDGRALQCRTCKSDASRRARARARADLAVIRRILEGGRGLKLPDVPRRNPQPTTARGR